MVHSLHRKLQPFCITSVIATNIGCTTLYPKASDNSLVVYLLLFEVIQTIPLAPLKEICSARWIDTLASVSGATIELYETDGSAGAAKGAGIGAGIYKDHNEAFASLKKLAVVEPDVAHRDDYKEAYEAWKQELNKL